MKRIFTSDAKTEGSLKIKRRTIVITNCEANWNSKGKTKGDGQASFHPVIVWEADDLEDDIESDEAPETLENAEVFQHGPRNGKFLKRHFPLRELSKHAPKYESKLFIKKKFPSPHEYKVQTAKPQAKTKLLAYMSIN